MADTQQAPTVQIPAGYRKDARGRLVPEAAIKASDLLRDKVVMDAVASAKELSKLLAEFKVKTFGEIETLEEISLEQYGVKFRGQKGNLSLASFDGKFKLLRANHDLIEFNEHLQTAKALLDECMREWTEHAHPGLQVMIDDAFRVDRGKQLRTSAILALRRHDIDDQRWKRAMDAIGDAIQIAGSRSYIRLYERVGETDKYEAINLDLAGV